MYIFKKLFGFEILKLVFWAKICNNFAKDYLFCQKDLSFP